MNVFQGTDRRNLTTFIENNGSLTVGAPLKLAAENGVIVTLNSLEQPDTPTLTGVFSYKIEGI